MPSFNVYYSVNPTLAISGPDGDHTGRDGDFIIYLTAALDVKLNNNLFKTGKIGYQDQMVIRSLLLKNLAFTLMMKKTLEERLRFYIRVLYLIYSETTICSRLENRPSHSSSEINILQVLVNMILGLVKVDKAVSFYGTSKVFLWSVSEFRPLKG